MRSPRRRRSPTMTNKHQSELPAKTNVTGAGRKEEEEKKMNIYCRRFNYGSAIGCLRKVATLHFSVCFFQKFLLGTILALNSNQREGRENRPSHHLLDITLPLWNAVSKRDGPAGVISFPPGVVYCFRKQLLRPSKPGKLSHAVQQRFIFFFPICLFSVAESGAITQQSSGFHVESIFFFKRDKNVHAVRVFF